MSEIFNIRLPDELGSRVKALANELNIPKSTAARLLMRRALDEPVGLAVIKEKVLQIHAIMQARQAQIALGLRDMLLALVDEIAPEVARDDDSPALALSAEQHQNAALEQILDDPQPEITEPAPIFGEDEEPDHGAGIRFSGAKRAGAGAIGRRKR